MQSKKVINFDIEANLNRNENFFKKARKYGKPKMEKIKEEGEKRCTLFLSFLNFKIKAERISLVIRIN